MQNVTGVLPAGVGKLLLALVHGFLGVTGQIYHRHDRKEPFLAVTPGILPGEHAVLLCFQSLKFSFHMLHMGFSSAQL